MIPTEDTLLVHAYLDDELDPAHALEIERRLAEEPALAVDVKRVEVLRRVINERLPRIALPPGLAARIEAEIARTVRPRILPPGDFAGRFVRQSPIARRQPWSDTWSDTWSVLARTRRVGVAHRMRCHQRDMVRASSGGRCSQPADPRLRRGRRGHGRCEPHTVLDGAAAGRRTLVGPPHREALVQWAGERGAARGRSRQ